MNNRQFKQTCKIFLSAIGFIISATGVAEAQVASSPPYTLEQSVIAGGGGTSSGSAGGAFSLTGAIGQAVAGVTSTNSPFALSGGFFTAQAAAAPTAAGVSVSGRVQTANGRGIRNVIITLTTADGATRAALTGAFGRYSFDDVAAGQTVILSARAKRFTFSQPTQVLSLTENASGVDFIGIGEFLNQ